MITRILANLFTFPYIDSGCNTPAPPPRAKKESLIADEWWVRKDGRVLPPAPPPRAKKESLIADEWWVRKDGRVLPPAPPPRAKR